MIKDGDEKLELKKGAYVQIISGKQTGLYGEVEGIDEETARYFSLFLRGTDFIHKKEFNHISTTMIAIYVIISP